MRVVGVGRKADRAGLKGTRSGTECRGWQCRRYDSALALDKSKHWFDKQLWRRHRYCLSAVSEVDERSDLGMLALPVLRQERETSATHSEFITRMEKVVTHLSHVRTSTVKLYRDVAKQENIKSRLKMFYWSLIQKEKEFFLSIEKSAISLNCELIKLSKEKSCSIKTL